jgi:hypothetical protein
MHVVRVFTIDQKAKSTVSIKGMFYYNKKRMIVLKNWNYYRSTRPGRNAESVARWVYEMASRRKDAEFELVDIKDIISRA